MDIGVKDTKHLTHHHDLENYLTPVVHHLGHQHIVLVTAEKYVGGGSRLLVGRVAPGAKERQMSDRHHFSCAVGSGVQNKNWKERLRSKLQASGAEPLPAGPVGVRMAWRCSSNRNWVSLWKPTGEALGPVLGEPDPRNHFNPADDCIVSLALHLNADDTLGHDVDVALWWHSLGDAQERLMRPRSGTRRRGLWGIVTEVWRVRRSKWLRWPRPPSPALRRFAHPTNLAD